MERGEGIRQKQTRGMAVGFAPSTPSYLEITSASWHILVKSHVRALSTFIPLRAGICVSCGPNGMCSVSLGWNRLAHMLSQGSGRCGGVRRSGNSYVRRSRVLVPTGTALSVSHLAMQKPVIGIEHHRHVRIPGRSNQRETDIPPDIELCNLSHPIVPDALTLARPLASCRSLHVASSSLVFSDFSMI